MIYALGLLVLACAGVYGLLLGYGYATIPEFLSFRRSTTVISFSLLLLTLEITGVWIGFHTPTPQEAVKKSISYAVAQGVARAMRGRMTLPEKVNDVLQLENIDARANRLVYTMSVSVPDSESFLRVVNVVRDDTRQNGCQREDYRTLMKFGLGIELDFKVIGSWGAPPVLLTPEMCELK